MASTDLSQSGSSRAGDDEGRQNRSDFLGLYHQRPIGAITVATIVALAIATPWALSTHVSSRDWVIAGALLAVFGCVTLLLRAAERWRYSIIDAVPQDMLACCTLAATFLLPSVLTAAVVVLVYLTEFGTRRGAPLYRWVYSVAAVIVTAVVTRTELNILRLPRLEALLIGGATYLVVDVLVMALALITCGERAHLVYYLSPTAWTTEASSAAIGLGVVEAVAHAPALGVLAVPAVIALQHWSRDSTVAETEALDPDSEVLGEPAFLAVVEQNLLGRERETYVLIYVQIPGLAPEDRHRCAQVLRRSLGEKDQLGLVEGGFGILIQASPAAAQSIALKRQADLAELGYLASATIFPSGTLAERLKAIRRFRGLG